MLAETDYESVFAEYAGPQPTMSAVERRLGELPEDLHRPNWNLIPGSDGYNECYCV